MVIPAGTQHNIINQQLVVWILRNFTRFIRPQSISTARSIKIRQRRLPMKRHIITRLETL